MDTNLDLVFTVEEQMLDFNDQYETFSALHPGFIRGKKDEVVELNSRYRKNCGAVSSQCSIRSNGDVKLCTMDTGSYFKLNMGNVFEKSLKDIYNENNEFLNALLDLPLPNYTSTDCHDCIYAHFCDSCLLRGFLRAKVKREECNWYKNQVPDIVAERFPLS